MNETKSNKTESEKRTLKPVRLKRLLYCPFCGSEGEYFEGENEVVIGHNQYGDNCGVRCTNKKCGASFNIGNYAGYKVEKRKEKAAEKWNRRTVKNYIKK